MLEPTPKQDAIAELCPSCGLCCNGVLFRDVELGARDQAEKLEALGLILQSKGRKLAFQQPCACFDGRLCRVYSERPARCRTFICGVLHRTQTGATAPAAALKLIRRAQQKTRVVRNLLAQLGNHDEAEPLTRRYAAVMAAPLDLSQGDEQADLRAKLMLEVDALMKFLHAHFLS